MWWISVTLVICTASVLPSSGDFPDFPLGPLPILATIMQLGRAGPISGSRGDHMAHA